MLIYLTNHITQSCFESKIARMSLVIFKYVVIFIQICFALGSSIIIGQPEEFAHMVTLRDSNNTDHFCTGAIFGYQQVLAATHCLQIKNITSDKMFVVGGESNKNFKFESNFKKIQEVYISKDGNISILQLKSPFDVDDPNISPIPIEFDNKLKKTCITVGWNQTESGMIKVYHFIDIDNWDKTKLNGEHIICDGQLTAIKFNQTIEYISLRNYSSFISSKLDKCKFDNKFNYEVPYSSLILLMITLTFCWLNNGRNQNGTWIKRSLRIYRIENYILVKIKSLARGAQQNNDEQHKEQVSRSTNLKRRRRFEETSTFDKARLYRQVAMSTNLEPNFQVTSTNLIQGPT